jgi:hypothetical protein
MTTQRTTPGSPERLPTPGEQEPGYLGARSRLPARSPHRWRLRDEAVLSYGLLGWESVLHARIYVPEVADGTGMAGGTEPGTEPVALLAQFGDHRGMSISNSIAEAAAAAQARFFPDGAMIRFALLVPYRSPWVTPTWGLPMFAREVGFDSRLRRSQWWQHRQERRVRRDRQRTRPAVTEVSPEGVTRHELPGAAPSTNPWEFHGARHRPDLGLELPRDERSALSDDDRVAVGPSRWVRPATVRIPALLGETRVATWPEELYTAELIGGPEAGALAESRHAAIKAKYEAINALTDPRPDRYWELE